METLTANFGTGKRGKTNIDVNRANNLKWINFSCGFLSLLMIIMRIELCEINCLMLLSHSLSPRCNTTIGERGCWERLQIIYKFMKKRIIWCIKWSALSTLMKHKLGRYAWIMIALPLMSNLPTHYQIKLISNLNWSSSERLLDFQSRNIEHSES